MKNITETKVWLLFLAMLFIMTVYIFTEKGAPEKGFLGIMLLINMIILAYQTGKWILIEFEFITYYINEDNRKTWKFNRPTK